MQRPPIRLQVRDNGRTSRTIAATTSCWRARREGRCEGAARRSPRRRTCTLTTAVTACQERGSAAGGTKTAAWGRAPDNALPRDMRPPPGEQAGQAGSVRDGPGALPAVRYLDGHGRARVPVLRPATAAPGQAPGQAPVGRIGSRGAHHHAQKALVQAAPGAALRTVAGQAVLLFAPFPFLRRFLPGPPKDVP